MERNLKERFPKKEITPAAQFLVHALQDEQAHLSIPNHTNTENWARAGAMTLTYEFTDKSFRQVDLKYKRPNNNNSPHKQNSWTIRRSFLTKLRQNSSPDTQRLFPLKNILPGKARYKKEAEAKKPSKTEVIIEKLRTATSNQDIKQGLDMITYGYFKKFTKEPYKYLYSLGNFINGCGYPFKNRRGLARITALLEKYNVEVGIILREVIAKEKLQNQRYYYFHFKQKNQVEIILEQNQQLKNLVNADS